MCRKDVILSNGSEEISFERRWSFIDQAEFADKTYIQELDDIFVASFLKLIS
jgi:hypothetical protein